MFYILRSTVLAGIGHSTSKRSWEVSHLLNNWTYGNPFGVTNPSKYPSHIDPIRQFISTAQHAFCVQRSPTWVVIFLVDRRYYCTTYDDSFRFRRYNYSSSNSAVALTIVIDRTTVKINQQDRKFIVSFIIIIDLVANKKTATVAGKKKGKSRNAKKLVLGKRQEKSTQGHTSNKHHNKKEKEK